ncbi:DUF4440 domain-containing protein [Rhodocaloribacter litoris]|uniref:YybH family protein n=1 Tax=Rhodocaloribacter litoris TaxID=2558931 RepID=UPI001421DC68|nr:DUF4440 domain-containing protein [Rhodocaloribacter litoris]QXD14395.1 DUF4440 domain-containing protein [Rhodocaloribacter litoris]GIV61008.1 MAG: hypothetical protein KatS3mg043_2097 [Rhodothermaceae bacterium]
MIHSLNTGGALAGGIALVLLVVWPGSGCTPPAPGEGFDPAAETRAVRDVLLRQVAAWNEGDVEGFMDGYARTDSLRFASGGSVRRGWQATLERYRAAYPGRDAMGTLSFDSLEVHVLSPRWATVFGRWHLRRSGGFEDAGGLFTLILEKRPEGWRVLYDHTSSGS